MYSQHSDAEKLGVAHPCGLIESITETDKQKQGRRKENLQSNHLFHSAFSH